MGNNLFIYGTLIDSRIQMEVFGRTVRGFPDVLRGYKKTEIMIDGETFSLIVPDATIATEGFIIEVNDEDLVKIDEYEGSEYKREKVVLESGRTAWVYIGR